MDTTVETPADTFRLLVDSVKDYAIFMLDPTGHVLTWNRGAERIKGYGADDIIGKHFSQFYSEDDVRAGKCEHELEIAARDGRFEDEGWRVRKDGSTFWANVVISAVRNGAGELLGFAKVTRDLTERERERLARAEAEAVAEEMQRQQREREMFVAVLGHDLRNPLSSIDMAAHYLIRLESLPDAVLRTASRIISSCTRMKRLIDQILDFARVRYGGGIVVDRQRTNLHDICRDVMSDIELQGKADRIRFELEGPGHGSWDRDRLFQVVQNLVQNALRYAPAETQVHLKVSPNGPGVTNLCIHNEGAPIPADALPFIFDPFRRATAEGGNAGLGLGLYIAQQIVIAHGGDMTVESEAGKGTTFRVTLPGALH
jgi:PAS domain S-box-containing protein